MSELEKSQLCPFCEEMTGRRQVRFHEATWHICTKCDSIVSISYKED